jgi:hypothetical protein
VRPVTGQTVVGHRIVEHRAVELAPRMAPGAQLALGTPEGRGMIGAVGVMTAGARRHLGMKVRGLEAERLRIVAPQTKLRLVDLQPQCPDKTMGSVASGAFPLCQRGVWYRQVLAHLGVTSGACAPLLESGTLLELGLGGGSGQDPDEKECRQIDPRAEIDLDHDAGVILSHVLGPLTRRHLRRMGAAFNGSGGDLQRSQYIFVDHDL